MVKRITMEAKRQIELKNFSRKLAGLELIEITVKHCTGCLGLFESIGNLTCGCPQSKEI